uniref:Uncharacterized protein n=1 Tax=Brassica oleracea TaxID=3712 RepID=A0A3P6B4M6_BRAOL|nr:unnamed protein product [Brassica oleracea]
MSALKSRSNSLAGLTLDAVLGGEILIQPSSAPSPPPLPQQSLVQNRTTTTSQTLFDIIRDEYEKEGHKTEPRGKYSAKNSVSNEPVPLGPRLFISPPRISLSPIPNTSQQRSDRSPTV